MRALLAIGILILVAALALVSFDLFGSGEEDETLVEEQVDIDAVDAKGPGFDVETGSVTPGEDEARSADAAPALPPEDEIDPVRTVRPEEEDEQETDAVGDDEGTAPIDGARLQQRGQPADT